MPGLQQTLQIPRPFEYIEIEDFGDVASFQDAVINHLNNLNRYEQAKRESLLDFLEDGDLNSLSVSKLIAGTLAVDAVYIGSTKFELDGLLRQMRIKDNQGTPITVVEIGEFATDDHGIKIRNAAGTVIFQASTTTTFIDGVVMKAGTITATALNVTELSAIVADLGTITAGIITAALIRSSASNPRIELTTTALTGYNSGGDVIFDLQTGGTVRFGDSGADNILFSSGVLTVTGDIIATGNIQTSAVTDAKVSDMSFSKITAGEITTSGIIKLASGADIQLKASSSGNNNLILFKNSSGLNKGVLAYNVTSNEFIIQSFNADLIVGSNTRTLEVNGAGITFDAGANTVKTKDILQPNSDNAISCGTASLRWSDLRSVLINGADIGFENGYYFTEALQINPNQIEEGLYLCNDNREPIMFIDQSGNLHIKGNVLSNDTIFTRDHDTRDLDKVGKIKVRTIGKYEARRQEMIRKEKELVN